MIEYLTKLNLIIPSNATGVRKAKVRKESKIYSFASPSNKSKLRQLSGKEAGGWFGKKDLLTACRWSWFYLKTVRLNGITSLYTGTAAPGQFAMVTKLKYFIIHEGTEISYADIMRRFRLCVFQLQIVINLLSENSQNRSIY